MGLPYAFASHFAPAALDAALAVYRAEFQPSAQLEQPYVIAGVNVIAADTTEAAQRILRAVRRARAISLFARGRGTDAEQLTDEQADQILAAGAAVHVDEMLTYAAVGTPHEVSGYLDTFLDQTEADELITVHQAPALDARLRSVTLLAESMGRAPSPSAR